MWGLGGWAGPRPRLRVQGVPRPRGGHGSSWPPHPPPRSSGTSAAPARPSPPAPGAPRPSHSPPAPAQAREDTPLVTPDPAAAHPAEAGSERAGRVLSSLIGGRSPGRVTRGFGNCGGGRCGRCSCRYAGETPVEALHRLSLRGTGPRVSWLSRDEEQGLRGRGRARGLRDSESGVRGEADWRGRGGVERWVGSPAARGPRLRLSREGGGSTDLLDCGEGSGCNLGRLRFHPRKMLKTVADWLRQDPASAVGRCRMQT